MKLDSGDARGEAARRASSLKDRIIFKVDVI